MKVELLMNAMNETQQHKHLFIIPILSNIVERQEAIVFTKSLDEEDYGTELKLEVAKLLYNKFLLERESKRFLNSILVGDL